MDPILTCASTGTRYVQLKPYIADFDKFCGQTSALAHVAALYQLCSSEICRIVYAHWCRTDASDMLIPAALLALAVEPSLSLPLLLLALTCLSAVPLLLEPHPRLKRPFFFAGADPSASSASLPASKWA